MDLIATFPSTQTALGAERTLKGEDLPVELIPVPRQIRGDCGFCLLVAGCGDPAESARRLRLLRACGAQALWRVLESPASPISRKARTYERLD
ncbi:MAG: DUF3343 domain-containing protein [Holophaga sp.]|jgi:hypothetical protein